MEEEKKLDFEEEIKKIEDTVYNFKLIEPLFPCQVYEKGLLIGMTPYKKDSQYIIVKNFKKYIEFAKIKSYEIEYVQNSMVLTTQYFDSRYLGLDYSGETKKKGKTVGWYVHGKIYSDLDKNEAIQQLINNFFKDDIKTLTYLTQNLNSLIHRYVS